MFRKKIGYNQKNISYYIWFAIFFLSPAWYSNELDSSSMHFIIIYQIHAQSCKPFKNFICTRHNTEYRNTYCKLPLHRWYNQSVNILQIQYTNTNRHLSHYKFYIHIYPVNSKLTTWLTTFSKSYQKANVF